MQQSLFSLRLLIACLLSSLSAKAQEGPFPIDTWPPTANPNSEVHYVVVDPNAFFDPLGNNWFNGDLSILSGGDQLTRTVAIGGHRGSRVVGSYLNIADTFYFDWADDPVIDILIQFYGDESVLGPDGQPRDFTFLTGTLPIGDGGNLNFVNGGSLPVEANNGKWNWALFRIENAIRPDGGRYVDLPAFNAQGSTGAGGVNGGTIRVENVPGLTVRVVAFGQEGAFGEPEQINQFFSKDFCEPEPETNHAWVDIDQDTSHHLEVLNRADHQVTLASSIGPANDQRRAVIADGLFMNFGITDDYLGKPCNDPVNMKICIEYYDDPALAGAVFGPEVYATDPLGGTDVFPPENFWVTRGTGRWEKIAFNLSGVNLTGVGTAPLTGGPRLIFETASLYISRVDIGITREGDHGLAGIDPLAECFTDPEICSELYGNYAELDFHTGLQEGLAPGQSGGDQEMIEAEAGPSHDRRLAVRPAFDDGSSNFPHRYLNFALVDEPFGPSSQPNAHLTLCVTYYDDPELSGATFRPEVFQVDRGGLTTFGFTSAEDVTELQGTGEWRDAYYEIPEIKFNGVNQAPQAAARFVLTDKIFFTRIRYGVIRPCGPSAGVNPLEECKPVIIPPVLSVLRNEGGGITIRWPAERNDFFLESTAELTPENWLPSDLVPETVDESLQVILQPDAAATFFRLAQ